MIKEIKKDNERIKEGETALHHAVQKGLIDPVKHLVEEKGYDVDEIDSKGYTPLFCAVEKSDLEMIKYLIEKGADVNAYNKNGATALHIAADLEIVKLLVEKGAYLDVNDDDGKIPLHSAAKNGHLEVVNIL